MVEYYSLTQRGFFSEIMNLVLAKIYCDKEKIELVVNTYHWNSRIDKGWNDYFKETLNTTNNILSSQYYVNGYKRNILRGLIKNPFHEAQHLTQCLLNYYYTSTSGNILSHDIFNKMRSKEVIGLIKSNEEWRYLLSITLNNIYIYNDDLNNEISANKKKIGINSIEYIGVHVRRGDKITTGEMSIIDIDKYISAIKAKKEISKNIYISTDDMAIIDIIKLQLGSEYSIFYNVLMSSTGFKESTYNKKSKEIRHEETKLAILDVDILKNSSYFIGTYSSNMSRIIPCFKGFDSCQSLDIPWSPIF
jgi:hypothetical protein